MNYKTPLSWMAIAVAAVTRRHTTRARCASTALALFVLVAVAFVPPVSAEDRAPQLSLPIACELGRTCFVQSLVDNEPGPEARDYRCGSATYDGHDGVDIRLPSASDVSKGVDVLAAADGVVKGTRDGMKDQFATGTTDARIQERECGNGVVIDHGGGWETQYCHMRKGSLAVRSGEKVARGARLGHVGYSGLAQFAHIHITVRHNGTAVDPMTGLGVGTACRVGTAEHDDSLWDAATRAALTYRNGEVIGAGFAAASLDLESLEMNHTPPPPNATSPALVFFARLTNLKAGDRVRVSVKGPEAFNIATTTEPMPRSKATYLAFAGRKIAGRKRWAAGTYEGHAELLRDGAVVAKGEPVRFELP